MASLSDRRDFYRGNWQKVNEEKRQHCFRVTILRWKAHTARIKKSGIYHPSTDPWRREDCLAWSGKIRKDQDHIVTVGFKTKEEAEKFKEDWDID